MDKVIFRALRTLNDNAVTPRTYRDRTGKEKPMPMPFTEADLQQARRTLSRMSGLELAEILIEHYKRGSGVQLFASYTHSQAAIEARELARMSE